MRQTRIRRHWKTKLAPALQGEDDLAVAQDG